MSQLNFNVRATLIAIGASVLLIPGLAQDSENNESTVSNNEIEEVTVTAQRVEENIQDVPISVTALTNASLKEQQVITPSDIQLNVPNVSFTSQNFGGFSFSIRGIGSLITGNAAEAGVSGHLNEIPLLTNLNIVEFFDLQRVEVLRGPQGTLFGRNATGGAVNFVTNMPDPNEFDAYLDGQFGSHTHLRLTGMINIPMEGFAVRFAFMNLSRNGYTENLADGNGLWNVDDDIDGRSQFAGRLTIAWDLNEAADLWVMYSFYDEDSDRARITNQVCQRNLLPTTGCTPNGFGFDTPHLGATLTGVFGAGNGAWHLGASGEEGTVHYAIPRPDNLDLRTVHTDFEPVFQEEDTLFAGGFEFEWINIHFEILGAFNERGGFSQQDYISDVGATIPPTALNPSGMWPTSVPSGSGGEDFTPRGCNILGGTGGVLGGCIFPGIDQTRQFFYDQSDGSGNYWVIEGKMQAALDAQTSYLLGASMFSSERKTNYFIMSNVLDMVSTYGAPLIQLPPLYPGFFVNSTSPNGDFGRTDEGMAFFGEVYYQLDDATKLTFGLRYNEDEKTISDTSILFDAINHVPLLYASVYPGIRATIAEILGVPVQFVPLQTALQGAIAAGLIDENHEQNLNVVTGLFWSRMTNFLLGPLATEPAEVGLAALYGVSRAELEAAMQTPAFSMARISIARRVPVVAAFGESRALTGSPNTANFNAITGRVTVDYRVNSDVMLFGSLATGYKPGGLNSAIPTQFQETSSFTFDREDVVSFEAGVKGDFLDGNARLNGSFFTYQYSGLQVTRIKNNSAINENVDANAWGFEAEGWFHLDALPQVVFDYAYSFLNTAVSDTMSLDPINRTAGNNDWVLLNNIDPGSLTGVNYIARKADITQAIVDMALQSGATFDVRNMTTPYPLSYAVNEHGVAIPVYFSRHFLNQVGVETRDGLLSDLDGNSLPNSPEHTFKIGMTYNMPLTTGLFDGSVALRGDLYWQSESFSREFNTAGDRIDSWMQINASATYTSNDGKMEITGWVRNLQDNDNVTGMYLTSDTSGFFRNYFLTEPRIAGVSIRYSL